MKNPSDRLVFLVMEPLDGGQKTVTSVQAPHAEEVFDNFRMTPQARPYRATLVVLTYGADGVTSTAKTKLLPQKPEGSTAVRLGEGNLPELSY